MTDTGIPNRETQYILALGNGRLLVICADHPNANDPNRYNGWYATWRAYLGREGEPMEYIGQVSVKSARGLRSGTEIGTSIGLVYAPAPWITGEQPTWDGRPIEVLEVNDWDVAEHADGTATAVRRQRDGASA